MRAVLQVENISRRRVGEVVARARLAQEGWAVSPVRDRTRVLRAIRHRIAENPLLLLNAIRSSRTESPESEILVSEILPFLDALKFAERNAERLLRTRRVGREGRPFWLSGVELEIGREPFGVVLVIAPSNYPLFLAGVHAMQALVAGNSAIVKPGNKGADAMHVLHEIARQAGLPDDVLQVLSEDPEDAVEAIDAGVDKIVLTGSAETGRAVLKRAAALLTPVTCELSGCDAVIALPGAEVELVAKALSFGLRLNQSQTCMRPHRVIVHESLLEDLVEKTRVSVQDVRIELDSRAELQLERLVCNAVRDGARHICGEILHEKSTTPFMFVDVSTTSSLWSADIFAPVLAFASYRSKEEAVQLHNDCPYGLTVSIFGPEAEACALADRLDAGTVLINDVIVPTADPRLPFSGRKHSGFGVTRGAEGIVEFTQLKAVSVRRSGRRHLEPSHVQDAALFSGAIKAAHAGSVAQRLKGAMQALQAVAKRGPSSPNRSSHS